MPERRRGRSGRPSAARLLGCLLAVGLLVGTGISRSAAASYPPLPIGIDRDFLANLSAPAIAPGAKGSVGFTVGDPMAGPITATELTLQVYAFNGFPGNASAVLPIADRPVLVTPTASGASVNVSLGTIAPGHVVRGSVGVVTSSATPSGTFAIRTAVSFTENGTDYRLESRGWFNATVWAAATTGPNGSAILNLSVLGVSGICPETAVLVATSVWPVVLGILLAASLGLAGVGAWIYFRRTSPSRSGAR